MQGAYSGLICGLIVALWLGISAVVYKPYVPTPRNSIAGCPIKNMTDWEMTTVEEYTTMDYLMTTTEEERPEDR